MHAAALQPNTSPLSCSSRAVPARTTARDMPGKDLGLGMAACNSDSCDSMVSTASNHSQQVSRPIALSPDMAHSLQHEISVGFLLKTAVAAQGPHGSRPQNAHDLSHLHSSDQVHCLISSGNNTKLREPLAQPRGRAGCPSTSRITGSQWLQRG